MSEIREALARVNRIPGVRRALIIAADDGRILEADLLIGTAGPVVATLAASLFRHANRSLAAAELGAANFFQLDGRDGFLFVVAPEPAAGRLLAVLAERRVNVGRVRLEAARIAPILR